MEGDVPLDSDPGAPPPPLTPLWSEEKEVVTLLC